MAIVAIVAVLLALRVTNAGLYMIYVVYFIVLLLGLSDTRLGNELYWISDHVAGIGDGNEPWNNPRAGWHYFPWLTILLITAGMLVFYICFRIFSSKNDDRE